MLSRGSFHPLSDGSARFIGAFAADSLAQSEKITRLGVTRGRGHGLLWICATRPASIIANDSYFRGESARTRSPRTNTGSCTATQQRQLCAGRNSGRIASQSLEVVPKRDSRKALKRNRE